MRAKRHSVIRTAAVATGVAAVLVLPASGAFAADASDAGASHASGTTVSHAMGRKSAVLPEDGIVGIAERIGQLPTGGLVGAAGALGAAGVGITVLRRRQTQQG
ncbi:MULTISPECIES: hypothetical protein [Streptomyces]|uniref:Uncharacterized protein n=2 Tax=Streptomyces rimosus subsp. rimosus TaxID=132474 RepID=L8EYZ7_STRR1|nr:MULTISPECIES: hypothetical protein [Streptomyces]KOG67325.1 hypothetical protein ADK78_41200 [Kitasatospora aureofaciens]MYT47377.1 hypothetical protein [Streptomyces sp. SID5471]KEF04706.1 hypothetical protein DF17_22735 [Streptomyces rimosus]KEF19889.1 hypothetical protein DF18_13635 [Streptomyces rimosus]KOT25855.1 hypothetical protein ADK42_40275 [Streptomyces rimosus subsp. rimosus]